MITYHTSNRTVTTQRKPNNSRNQKWHGSCVFVLPQSWLKTKRTWNMVILKDLKNDLMTLEIQGPRNLYHREGCITHISSHIVNNNYVVLTCNDWGLGLICVDRWKLILSSGKTTRVQLLREHHDQAMQWNGSVLATLFPRPVIRMKNLLEDLSQIRSYLRNDGKIT